MSRRSQRMLEPADDQPAHEAGIPEPNLRLRGMDIDVDRPRVDFQE